MNTKRFAFVLGLVLLTLFANSSSAAAYPAELPEITWCNQVATIVDIPARRVDYLRMDNPVPCPVVAGTSTVLIPNTGTARPTGHFYRFQRPTDLLSPR